MSYDEDFDDEYDDEEYDVDDQEDEATIPCPYCHEEVHEDAQWCPHCEQYISEEDAPGLAKPWWILLGAIAALVGMLWWIL
jgi:uncharacterized paraquat-inducible protein A